MNSTRLRGWLLLITLVLAAFALPYGLVTGGLAGLVAAGVWMIIIGSALQWFIPEDGARGLIGAAFVVLGSMLAWSFFAFMLKEYYPNRLTLWVFSFTDAVFHEIGELPGRLYEDVIVEGPSKQVQFLFRAIQLGICGLGVTIYFMVWLFSRRK